MNINFIIPCYNEQEILYNSIKYLLNKIKKNSYIYDFRITLIDDGSVDNTWKIINKLHDEENRVNGIKFLKNYGHLSALNAGFVENNYDYILMLDADFMIEFPNNLVDQLIETMKLEKCDIVQVARNHYNTSFFKSTSSNLFYLLFNLISNIKITASAPDFRIINKKVFEKLRSLNHKIFFRKEIHAHNFKIKLISFDQTQTILRKSRFTLKKMLNFALESLIFNTGFFKKKNNFVISEKIL